jgi:hypothetical protein
MEAAPRQVIHIRSPESRTNWTTSNHVDFHHGLLRLIRNGGAVSSAMAFKALIRR